MTKISIEDFEKVPNALRYEITVWFEKYARNRVNRPYDSVTNKKVTLLYNSLMEAIDYEKKEPVDEKAAPSGSPLTFDFACRDDCLDCMVPSDLRILIAERDWLKEHFEKVKSAG